MVTRLVHGEWPVSQLAGRHPLINQQFEPWHLPRLQGHPFKPRHHPSWSGQTGVLPPRGLRSRGETGCSFWSAEICCSLLSPAVAAVLAVERGCTVRTCLRPVSALSTLAPELLSGALLPVHSVCGTGTGFRVHLWGHTAKYPVTQLPCNLEEQRPRLIG